MNSFHIGAGTLPPDTFLMSSPLISTLVRGSCSSAKPIQTEEVYWGINPMNQASLKPWCVPVLPAIGLSSNTALVPVPNCAATSSVFLTAAAAPGSGMETLWETIFWYNTWPFESSILSIR